MAVPATPTSFYAQQGNGQAFLSWAISASATSYKVQRSTDGVTFTTLATPATNSYLDTSTLVGVQYYYQVAATNGSGDSAYTAAQSVIPTYTGDMSLGQIRWLSQARADRLNSNFVTLPEWNLYINQSAFELYDLLTTTYEDYNIQTVSFPTDGSAAYNLPNGSNYAAALPFYKLRGVDLALNSITNSWVSLKKFNFTDRNKYVYPNASSTIYGVSNLQYRVMGSQIQFIPQPSPGQTIRLWYIPRSVVLLKDTDILDGISGWSEYVIVDAAIKALMKEEQPTQELMLLKGALIKRIEESAANRDAGQPDTISDIRSGGFGGWNGPIGGW